MREIHLYPTSFQLSNSKEMLLLHLSFLHLDRSNQIVLHKQHPELYTRCVREILNKVTLYSKIRPLVLTWDKHNVRTISFSSA